MRLRLPASRIHWLVLSVFLFDTHRASAESKPVSFETVDGVTLKGTFYPSAKGKGMPTVLLLHTFEAGKGGDSTKDGWGSLAEELNKKDFSVLSFDFRGHGNSTEVSADFWKQPHNSSRVRKGPAKDPPTVSHSQFTPAYYPYLVNDILAAKAFLDQRHDSGDINTQNLIVIGAGEGATLGAMWLASEWKRVQYKNPGGLARPEYSKPEGREVGACIWLNISPSLGRVNMPLQTWIQEIGKVHKTPQAFVYSKEDPASESYNLRLLRIIIPNYVHGKKPEKADKDLEFTTDFPVPAAKNLKGSQLLDKDLETEKWIVTKYLPELLEKKPAPEHDTRDFRKNTYVWLQQPGANPMPAKSENDRIFKLLPLQIVGLR